MFILPHESGEGGPPCAAGWWKGRRTRRNFRNDHEAPSQTPPPPRCAWSPSPASRGRMTCDLVLAMRLRIRVLPRHCKKALPTTSQQKKGGGAPTGAIVFGAASADAAAVSAETARLSALHRGARQGGRIHHWLSSSTALPETRLQSGVTLCRLSQVNRAPRRPVVVPVGRGPRAARARFARPRAGTALAPPSRSHPECALR